MSPIDERLKSLNIVLPDVMPPVVDGYVPAFAPFTRSGLPLLTANPPHPVAQVDLGGQQPFDGLTRVQRSAIDLREDLVNCLERSG
jgi:hypothetical protein